MSPFTFFTWRAATAFLLNERNTTKLLILNVFSFYLTLVNSIFMFVRYITYYIIIYGVLILMIFKGLWWKYGICLYSVDLKKSKIGLEVHEH